MPPAQLALLTCAVIAAPSELLRSLLSCMSIACVLFCGACSVLGDKSAQHLLLLLLLLLCGIRQQVFRKRHLIAVLAVANVLLCVQSSFAVQCLCIANVG